MNQSNAHGIAVERSGQRNQYQLFPKNIHSTPIPTDGSMAFQKLRSLTPHRHRKSTIEEESVADPPPIPRTRTRSDATRSQASRDQSVDSSVNLDISPSHIDPDRGRIPEPRVSDSYDVKGIPTYPIEPSSPSTIPDARELHSSREGSDETETDATSIHTLPPLQSKGPAQDFENQLDPVAEDDPSSYDLLNPASEEPQAKFTFSLEDRGEQLFSRGHLQAIFDDPAQMQKFTTFLGKHRPQSVPVLIYYLDALKARSAIKYSNAVVEALEPLRGHEFTKSLVPPSWNKELEERANKAFEVLVREELPAFITYTWVSVVSTSIHRRITGTMPPHLKESSEGLAEVFCLSDPSRPDNPLVFASEEFHRTTQYGVNYAIGRNCRFLQGPRTSEDSINRLRDAIHAGRETCETFVNYRRDGSPFMNLLMMAPLRDSRGKLRYFIGAQVDVSGLAKECTQLESMQRMLAEMNDKDARKPKAQKNEFQNLSEMFNQTELSMVRKYGGRMHREQEDEEDDAASSTWHRPRLLLNESSSEETDKVPKLQPEPELPSKLHGKLVGVYQHYLLVRPYPSLRILFASPSLRVPGILQSPFMNRIGSSERIKEELVSALGEGRGVTAKVRWVSKHEDEGRNRWIHCTPLLGSNGNVGVWMVVLVDDETSKNVRRFRPAPPVPEQVQRQEERDRRAFTSMGLYGRQSSYNASRDRYRM